MRVNVVVRSESWPVSGADVNSVKVFEDLVVCVINFERHESKS